MAQPFSPGTVERVRPCPSDAAAALDGFGTAGLPPLLGPLRRPSVSSIPLPLGRRGRRVLVGVLPRSPIAGTTHRATPPTSLPSLLMVSPLLRSSLPTPRRRSLRHGAMPDGYGPSSSGISAGSPRVSESGAHGKAPQAGVCWHHVFVLTSTPRPLSNAARLLGLLTLVLTAVAALVDTVGVRRLNDLWPLSAQRPYCLYRMEPFSIVG